MSSRSKQVIPRICLALELSFGLLSIKWTLASCRPVQATKLEHKLHRQRLMEVGLLRLKKTRLLGDLSRSCCGAYGEDGVVLFSELHYLPDQPCGFL